MAYKQNMNNPLAIWTAFNGLMGDSVTFSYGADFAFVVSMTDQYLTFGFNISGNPVISWGDGTKTDYEYVSGAISHDYAAAGDYTVTIDGNILSFSFLYSGINTGLNVSYQRLTRLLTPLPKAFSEWTDFDEMFCCCTLLTEIPEDLFINCTKAKTFRSCFSGHVHQVNGALIQYPMTLQSIPEGLFQYCPEATDFSNCFTQCKALTSIPEGLFANQPLVTSFAGCFSCCTMLTSIPEGLFANCPEVTDFSSCFGGYRYTFMRNYVRGTHITTIPAGLFANNHKVTSFYNTFGLNPYLVSIPAGLFDPCPLVTDFAYCFGGYRYSLSQYCYPKIASIPAALFANNPLVTTFRECFSGCTTLTSIPGGIFDSNPLVDMLLGAFSYCTKVTSSVPALWASFPSANGTECFKSCTKAANYASIPDGWK